MSWKEILKTDEKQILSLEREIKVLEEKPNPEQHKKTLKKLRRRLKKLTDEKKRLQSMQATDEDIYVSDKFRGESGHPTLDRAKRSLSETEEYSHLKDDFRPLRR